MIHRSWASRIIRLAHAAVCTSSPLWTRVTGRQGRRVPGASGRHVGPCPPVPVPPRRSLRGARVRARMLRSARRSRPHPLRQRRRGPRRRLCGRPIACCGGSPQQADPPGARESEERVRPSRRWDAPGGPRLHVRYWHRVQPRVGPDLQRSVLCTPRSRRGAQERRPRGGLQTVILHLRCGWPAASRTAQLPVWISQSLTEHCLSLALDF